MNIFLMVARGGSKGIPGKNLVSIGGESLVSMRARVAKNCSFFDRYIMSTDDPQIASEALRSGLEVPFIRPSHLATDSAATLDVVSHAIGFLEDQGVTIRTIFLCEPSSPFCRIRDFQSMVEIYTQHKPHLVASVVKSKVPPIHLGKIGSCGEFGEVSKRLARLHSGNRQQHDSYFYFNGAIYLIDYQKFKANQIIFPESDDVRVFEMPFGNSVEIDEKFDLIMANALLQAGVVDLELT